MCVDKQIAFTNRMPILDHTRTQVTEFGDSGRPQFLQTLWERMQLCKRNQFHVRCVNYFQDFNSKIVSSKVCRVSRLFNYT